MFVEYSVSVHKMIRPPRGSPRRASGKLPSMSQISPLSSSLPKEFLFDKIPCIETSDKELSGIPTPFWFGEEEQDQIRSIFAIYHKQVGVDADRPKNSRRPLRFIGRIRRTKLRPDEACFARHKIPFQTLDEILVFERLIATPGSALTPIQTAHMIVTWDGEEGVPISMETVSEARLSKIRRRIVPAVVSYLYCRPVFLQDDDYAFSRDKAEKDICYWCGSDDASLFQASLSVLKKDRPAQEDDSDELYSECSLKAQESLVVFEFESSDSPNFMDDDDDENEAEADIDDDADDDLMGKQGLETLCSFTFATDDCLFEFEATTTADNFFDLECVDDEEDEDEEEHNGDGEDEDSSSPSNQHCSLRRARSTSESSVSSDDFVRPRKESESSELSSSDENIEDFDALAVGSEEEHWSSRGRLNGGTAASLVAEL